MSNLKIAKVYDILEYTLYIATLFSDFTLGFSRQLGSLLILTFIII